jgi:glucose-6-phosphate 1-dehydrogenase
MSPKTPSLAARPTAGRPKDHVIVVFGATGDLAKRELLPGLFHLAVAGLLPPSYRIVGTARSQGAPSEAEFKEHARQAIAEFGTTKPEGEAWKTFEDTLAFATADSADPSPLVSAVQDAE